MSLTPNGASPLAAIKFKYSLSLIEYSILSYNNYKEGILYKYINNMLHWSQKPHYVLISIRYLHKFPRQRFLTDRRTDGRTPSQPIVIPYFEVRYPKNGLKYLFHYRIPLKQVFVVRTYGDLRSLHVRYDTSYVTMRYEKSIRTVFCFNVEAVVVTGNSDERANGQRRPIS